MLKLTIAVLAVALAGTASAAGWRSLRVDASSEASFTESVAAFQQKLSPARNYVFLRALQDIWVQGTKSAEAEQGEYTDSDYLRQLDGLGYDAVVKLTDPTGDTTKIRLREAYAALNARMPQNSTDPWPERAAPIGPHGEQVRGIVDSGPAYQHSLRTMGQ